MVIWLYGYMVIWLYGYMVIWLYGCMVAWLLSYVFLYGGESSGVGAKRGTLNFLVQNGLLKSRAGQVVSDHHTGNIVVYAVFICKCVVCRL
jgi:hypothetical protein